MQRRARLPLLLLVLCAAGACGDGHPVPPPGAPNVLWVVWDTVRADRLSLYGHERPTTPRLEAWATGARVFDDALSTAGYTLPSHASLFTGLLPSEHCTHNGHPRLEDRYETLAELLHAAGWRTFLFSANPQISAQPSRNFAQGFERAAHPWDPRWRQEALAIVRSKLDPRDRSSELGARLEAAGGGPTGLTPWNIKAAGSLAERALLEWLGEGDPKRPWFAFLNYMEAHRPLIPPRAYRERLMSDAQVERSYEVDRSWLPMWEYTFGLRDYDDEELALTAATYDAALRELDDLFASLLDALSAAGQLENTVVVLTSDHGEHLGEHHMLDHQYSVYQPLLRVPLVIFAPGRVEPGRDDRPASSFDLFPTILALAGVDPPEGQRSRARSLLDPPAARLRLAEEPAVSEVGIRQVRRAHPDWDPSPFQRRLRALVDGSTKLLWGSDERVELYDLASDPLEERDLAAAQPERAGRLRQRLDAFYAGLEHCDPSSLAEVPEPTSPEERRMLEALGYLEPADGTHAAQPDGSARDAAEEPPAPDGDAAAIDPQRREALQALGYLDVGEPLTAGEAVGVRIHDRTRARPGLNLYTDARACATHLMDMEGAVHHSWSGEPCHRWDNTVLLPGGDLLVTAREARGRSHAQADAARYLIRLAWKGETRWKKPLPVHHDVELTPQGRILAMTHRFRRIPSVHPKLPVREHLLTLLADDGEILEEVSLWDLLQASPGMLEPREIPPRTFEGEREVDVFHSNSVEWMRQPRLEGRSPLYGPNTVLVSIRNQDAFVVFDWKTRELLWAWGPGELAAPHDATLLPDGNILGFDNGMGRGWSRVVEIDPRSGEIVWEYRAPEPGDFYSETRGAAQRLSNGNTLVTESGAGRVFEVTRSGEVVWEFVNPALSAKREPGVIVRMRRLEGLDFAGLTARLERGEPLPSVD